jgi:hypothetical protein
VSNGHSTDGSWAWMARTCRQRLTTQVETSCPRGCRNGNPERSIIPISSREGTGNNRSDAYHRDANAQLIDRATNLTCMIAPDS